MKLRPGDTLVIASHNKGKVGEIIELLAPYRLHVISAGDLGVDEPDETADSFKGNAALKAGFVATTTGHPSLADDSGLCVAALDGSPGIYSARWAGPQKNFSLAIARVEDELRARRASDMAAKFVCALALVWPFENPLIFQGEVHSHLVFPGRGSQGFGYDPIFVADHMTQTFGELDPAAKHAISHRARAFAQLQQSSVFAP